MAWVGEQDGDGWAVVRPRTRSLVLFGAVLLLTLATRLPFIPEHLYSFDSVNLALALKEFDPSRHQPQPPGYPLFVAEARLIQRLVGTPEKTFTILKVLISSLSVMLLYLLGRRMFSGWVGLAAAGLFFFNPVFWYAGLTSSLRLHLALVSVLVAYFCWRACCGEPRYSYAASIALGLGAGFRPELTIFLAPLWAWTVWQPPRTKLFLACLFLFLAGTIGWVLVLVVAYGGAAQMVSSFLQYLSEQSQSVATLSGSPLVEWRRMAGRAFLWNGIGMLPWIWTIPLAWRHRNRLARWNRQLIFLALWFFPAFLFHLTVHIGAPGHALATIPAICLAGGLCTLEAQEILAKKRVARFNPIGLAIVLVLLGNVALFFWPYPVLPRREVTQFRGWASVRDAISAGAFETSYARVRYVGSRTRQALKQIGTLKSGAERPVLLLWNTDALPSWRQVTYYYPSDDLYEVVGRRTPQPRARLWKGPQLRASSSGSLPLKISVPKNGRLIWLLYPDVVGELRQVVSLQEASPLYYTDLSDNSPNFRWGSFEFVPE